MRVIGSIDTNPTPTTTLPNVSDMDTDRLWASRL